MVTKDTIVTAIYHYSYESRMGGRNYTFEYYENPFCNLLSLNCNIVVFSHAEEIKKIIAFFEKNNFVDYKVIDYNLDNYIHSDSIYEIKEKKGIINENGLVPGVSIIENDRNTHLCLSKIDFVKNAITNNYFNSDRYYWVDAGLFHHGLFPLSLGGAERFLRPDKNHFWPENSKNICNTDLIDRLNKKNNNSKLLFLGLTAFSEPTWLRKLPMHEKRIHIVGGMFGGEKDELLKVCSEFEALSKKILGMGELTLEEDILSIIITKNDLKHLKFDTWGHDIPSDPCYYGISVDNNCFYKLFM